MSNEAASYISITVDQDIRKQLDGDIERAISRLLKDYDNEATQPVVTIQKDENGKSKLHLVHGTGSTASAVIKGYALALADQGTNIECTASHGMHIELKFENLEDLAKFLSNGEKDRGKKISVNEPSHAAGY